MCCLVGRVHGDPSDPQVLCSVLVQDRPYETSLPAPTGSKTIHINVVAAALQFPILDLDSEDSIFLEWISGPAVMIRCIACDVFLMRPDPNLDCGESLSAARLLD